MWFNKCIIHFNAHISLHKKKRYTAHSTAAQLLILWSSLMKQQTWQIPRLVFRIKNGLIPLFSCVPFVFLGLALIGRDKDRWAKGEELLWSPPNRVASLLSFHSCIGGTVVVIPRDEARIQIKEEVSKLSCDRFAKLGDLAPLINPLTCFKFEMFLPHTKTSPRKKSWQHLWNRRMHLFYGGSFWACVWNDVFSAPRMGWIRFFEWLGVWEKCTRLKQ